jgi:SAM-dependent methyltransferase
MESWKHLALDERERFAGVQDLALFISEPGSVWEARGLSKPRDYVEKMRGSLERARDFTRMLYEVHQNLANELVFSLDLSGVCRLMDLGGNSGVVSMALLQKYPGLTATVVDIENVCIAGREIAEEKSFSDRITYYPAEFEKDAFPGGFDLVIKCDVYVFGVELFRKIWSSLNPGGRLVIVDLFSPAENVVPTSRLEWTFLDSLEDPNISIPTVAQVREQLAQAGFQPLPGETILPNNWTVIQARK